MVWPCVANRHQNDGFATESSETTEIVVFKAGGTLSAGFRLDCNMTKDEKGYTYGYDYENRIAKVWKNGGATDVAEYVYDALGRRIRKEDCLVSSNSRWYYYNDKWQVTAAYGVSDSVTTFLYGNYVDEVLRMTNSSGTYYYGHDQLYSPVILVNAAGSIEDRYEYDAYGACRVLNADYTADSDGKPDFGNPFLFTGREVDFLDNGSCILQYNRHRYYSQSLGRWTSEDPLGIDPAGELHQNTFNAGGQYKDGLLLYAYVRNRPLGYVDSSGLACGDCLPPRNSKRNFYDKKVVAVDLNPLLFSPAAYDAARWAAVWTGVVSDVEDAGSLIQGPGEIGKVFVKRSAEEVERDIPQSIIDNMLPNVANAMGRGRGNYLYILVTWKSCEKCNPDLLVRIFYRPGCDSYDWKRHQQWHRCDGPNEWGRISTRNDLKSAYKKCVRKVLRNPSNPDLSWDSSVGNPSRDMLDEAGY